jgi:hypothetical protein
LDTDRIITVCDELVQAMWCTREGSDETRGIDREEVYESLESWDEKKWIEKDGIIVGLAPPPSVKAAPPGGAHRKASAHRKARFFIFPYRNSTHPNALNIDPL